MARVRKRRPRRYRPSARPQGGGPRLLPRPRVEIDRGLAWYCLWTASRAERRVDEALRNNGIATYVPIEVIEVEKRGRLVEQERLAVSRYVFVGLNGFRPQWDAVREALEGPSWWMTGVPALGRVLMVDGEPLRVPSGALQRLADGLTVLDSGQSRFAAGGAVRAVSGPWANFLFTVESEDDCRVRALIDIFGRPTRVEFEHSQLEAA